MLKIIIGIAGLALLALIMAAFGVVLAAGLLRALLIDDNQVEGRDWDAYWG